MSWLEKLKALTKEIPEKKRRVLEWPQVALDYSRNSISTAAWELLEKLYLEKVPVRVQAMFAGEEVNSSERRAACHPALRAAFAGSSAHTALFDKGMLEAVETELTKVEQFVNEVREKKQFKEVVVVGIGGSYLGTAFLAEALSYCTTPDLPLHFIANIDPEAAHHLLATRVRCLPTELLVVVVSKTFTTRETLLNLLFLLKTQRLSLSSVVAVTAHPDPRKALQKFVTALPSTLRTEEVALDSPFLATFAMWDWVGGRFSVTSAVGLLPLGLSFGMSPIREMLAGAAEVDALFYLNRNRPLETLPAVLALTDFFVRSVQGISTKAILPYSEALSLFPAYVQQLEMESNGKAGRLSSDSNAFFVFGEPGTKGQHSFYQLLHQGQLAFCDFLAFRRPSSVVAASPFARNNFDELMANFFAQPEALFAGKSSEDPNKCFPGARPSNTLLFDHLSPSVLGCLLAVYEHRIVVQGFLWELNSFDQMGVQLGKELGLEVKKTIEEKKNVTDEGLLDLFIKS